MANLLRCPFCGSFNLGHRVATGYVWVECYQCGAKGPVTQMTADWREDNKTATYNWNTRSIVPQNQTKEI